MRNKQIQKSRMWKYFVEATAQIIEEEGIEQVTIRKVADRAGYNSATIYNYFAELSHLVFFAAMTFMKNYTKEVAERMKEGKNALDKYLIAWDCFSLHSFQQPHIFHAVFVMDLGDHPEKLLEDYYDKYPADLITIPEDIKPILLERSMTKRGLSLLSGVVKEGMLTTEQAKDINEMSNLIWQGMLVNLLNNRSSYTEEQAHTLTIQYVKKIIQAEAGDLVTIQ